MCHTKKSLETYLLLLVSMSMGKMSGNIFNDHRINKSAYAKRVWKLI